MNILFLDLALIVFGLSSYNLDFSTEEDEETKMKIEKYGLWVKV